MRALEKAPMAGGVLEREGRLLWCVQLLGEVAVKFWGFEGTHCSIILVGGLTVCRHAEASELVML